MMTSDERERWAAAYRRVWGHEPRPDAAPEREDMEHMELMADHRNPAWKGNYRGLERSAPCP